MTKTALVALASCSVVLLAGCGSTVQGTSVGQAGSSTSADGQGLGVDNGTAPGVALPQRSTGALPDAGQSAVRPSAPGQPQVRASLAVPAAPARRGPIRVGVFYSTTDAEGATGTRGGQTFSLRRALEAAVATANERGGVGGRVIQPVYEKLNATSSNYATVFQAACTTFTQDEKVEVVISVLGAVSEQFSSCLNRAGIPQVIGDYAVGDDEQFTTNPLLFAPSGVTPDRRAAALLTTMTATGYLAKGQQIGVLVDECSPTQRAFKRSFAPSAQSLGLSIVTASVRCMNGFGDYSGVTTDLQGAVLRFRSQNVTRVILFTDFEALMLLLFSTSAESQGYRPQYALTSLADVALQGPQSGSSPNQLKNMRGLGWLPAVDSQSSPVVTAAAKTCVDMLRSSGVSSPQGPTDYLYAFAACDAVNALDAVLTRSQGSTARASYAAAIAAVGTSLRSAQALGGAMDLSSHRDGAVSGRIFSWADGCSCFRYEGPTRPL